MRSTQEQLKEFEKSLIWLDIKDFLTTRLEAVRDELEGNTKILDLFNDVKDTMLNRGRAEEIRFLLDLPNVLATNYKALVKEDSDGGRSGESE